MSELQIHDAALAPSVTDTPPSDERPAQEGRSWTFLSPHAHLLLALSREPGARMKDLARDLQITERSVQRIVADLEAEGFLERHRRGRRNTYTLHLDGRPPQELEAELSVASLVEALRGG